jgi:hypothetical protein
MDVMEKLIDLIVDSKRTDPETGRFTDYLADYLVLSGVTVQEWISVDERLPENEVDVLICAQRRYYKGGTIPVVSIAFHTDGKMKTEESGYNWDLGNVDMEYDEEADAYIVPEGWWESVRYGEEFSAVDDFVTHWQPMPQPPKGGE